MRTGSWMGPPQRERAQRVGHICLQSSHMDDFCSETRRARPDTVLAGAGCYLGGWLHVSEVRIYKKGFRGAAGQTEG